MTCRPAAIPLLFGWFWFSTACAGPTKLRSGGTQRSLFAHRRPVCTTEIGRLALKYKDLASKVSCAGDLPTHAFALLVHCFSAFSRSTHLVLAVPTRPQLPPLLYAPAPACPALYAA